MWVDDGFLRKIFFFFMKVINNFKGLVFIYYLKRWGRGCLEVFWGLYGFKGEWRGD